MERDGGCLLSPVTLLWVFPAASEEGAREAAAKRSVQQGATPEAVSLAAATATRVARARPDSGQTPGLVGPEPPPPALSWGRCVSASPHSAKASLPPGTVNPVSLPVRLAQELPPPQGRVGRGEVDPEA